MTVRTKCEIRLLESFTRRRGLIVEHFTPVGTLGPFRKSRHYDVPRNPSTRRPDSEAPLLVRSDTPPPGRKSKVKMIDNNIVFNEWEGPSESITQTTSKTVP